VYIGGGIAADRADFGRLVGKVPARRAAATLERLLDFYVSAGAPGRAFWQTVSLDAVRALIADLAELADAAATDADFIDLGETAAFEVATSDGECSA
jgi:hypothetical protein